MVQRAAAHDEIERLVDERQPLPVALLQQHIVDARVAQPPRGEIEQLGREIERHDLPHVRRQRFRDVRGAARDLEHEHVGRERSDPRRRVRAPRERRVGTGKSVDLPPERPPDDFLVLLVALVLRVSITRQRKRLTSSSADGTFYSS